MDDAAQKTEPSLEQPEPALEDDPRSEPATNGVPVEVPRWARVTFADGGVQIEWSGIGPVDLLGAAGYMEWQAKYLLDSEMRNRERMQRVVVPADHLGPGGRPRGN